MNKNLSTLSEKVGIMLETENKNRKIAIKFIEKVTEILEEVAHDMWGKNYDGYELYHYTKNVTILQNDGKRTSSFLYFRYGNNHNEEVNGFYVQTDHEYFLNNILDLRGKELWYQIQLIYNWLPQIIEDIEKRCISRSDIVNKLKIVVI